MQRNLFVILIGLLLGLNACSVVDERKAAYKDIESTAVLEIPPDLLSMEAGDELAVALAPLGGSVTLSELNQLKVKDSEAGPLQTTDVVGVTFSENLRLERDGAEQWLVAMGTPAQWWDEVILFWSLRDIEIERKDPLLGVMQTEWIKEGKTSRSSFLKKQLSKFYDSGIRDQYIVRFEAGLEEGTTEIHIIHRGMREDVVGKQKHWLPRPSENDLEIEVLKQLAIHISKDDVLAERLVGDRPMAVKLARLVESDDGVVSLRVILPFSKAWRRTGNALVQMDLNIDDFNRASGLIEMTGVMAKGKKEKSFTERLFGADEVTEEKFNLQFKEQGSEVVITMLDEETGEQHDSPDTKNFFERLALLLNQG